jgi:hypothetical protein
VEVFSKHDGIAISTRSCARQDRPHDGTSNTGLNPWSHRVMHVRLEATSLHVVAQRLFTCHGSHVASELSGRKDCRVLDDIMP